MAEDTPMGSQMESQDIEQETPTDDVFVPPSVNASQILAGESYTYISEIPEEIKQDLSTECVLGVDEAGRGPVLGPMVYGVYYLPIPSETPLLRHTHHFDDSKALTPIVRSSLMQTLCTPSTDLHKSSGWATRVMSARDISSNMLKPFGTYNLNAQAMDATIDLIKNVFSQGVNVKEIYIDTIGRPETYQSKMEKIFPTTKVTVAKKADSLYPCVSAASVCAKVTRDAALEALYESYAGDKNAGPGWGSGYPSDSRTSGWIKQNMDPLFGWGSECRFSWGTAKDLLEEKNTGLKVEWPDPEDDDDDNMKMSAFFFAKVDEEQGNELSNWFGQKVTAEAF